jgi:hypothetical protein
MPVIDAVFSRKKGLPQQHGGIREAAGPRTGTGRMSNTASCKRPAAEMEIIEILDDSDEEDDDSHEIVPTCTCGVVPLERFLEMWRDVEVDDGWDTERFESTGSFRRANSSVDKEDTSTQGKAQYGRIMFKATSIIFERIMGLKYFHTFLDIGHGVGNTVLQAAYTVGCESRGIEVVNVRHERAFVYQEKLAELDDLLNKKRDGKVRILFHQGDAANACQVSHSPLFLS